MSEPLTGILSALVTPFNQQGQIDEDGLRKVVDRNIDGGIHGVVACGSTGEFSSLSGAERRLVVETVIDQTAGRVPVIAQTGAQSTWEAIELSQHAEQAGASVLMLVAPYYEPLSIDETEIYLRAVADSVNIPVMLYNLPVATGVNMAPDFVGRLAKEVDNILYVKDTTGDLAQAGQLIHHYGDVVSTFVGWDSLMLGALIEGAAGAMAGTANVFPAHLISIHEAIKAGDLGRAGEEWNALYPALDAIMSVPFVSAVKCAMNATGFNAGAPRHPVQALSGADAEKLSALAANLPALPA